MPDDPSDMINADEFARYVRASGVATTQYLAEVSDVFYREQTLHISLHSDLQAKVLAEIFTSWFAHHDWNEERGLHWVESSIGGNDWLRVYRRGDSLIRVHIVGLWEDDNGFKPIRSVSLRFYRCDSSVMFTAREDGGVIFNDY